MKKGLNNLTNVLLLGIATPLAGEIIEPPRQARPYMYSEGAVPERLNNPTGARRLGIEWALASEIIEPPRDQCGYRRTIRRGSIIPPAGETDVGLVYSLANG